MRKTRPPLERFLERVHVVPCGGCWLWTAGLFNTGYGAFHDGERQLLAHRFAYELQCGPIPEGLELDHLCRVRSCCNPEHLEAVTHAENMRRGNTGKHHADKTHCPQGHPYSGDNLYVEPGTGRRHCRTCRTATGRFRYRNRREARRSSESNG